MNRLTTLRRALPALAVGLLAACASLGGSAGGAEDSDSAVEVRVDNNVRGGADVSVALVDAQGNRRSLGTVSQGATRSFDVSVSPAAQAHYRLMAEPDAGETLVSPDLTISGRAIIQWELRSNQLQTFRPEADPGG